MPAAVRRASGLAVVRGRSMQPTLHDGDRLLVRHGAVPAAATWSSSACRTGWSRSSGRPPRDRRRLVGRARQPRRGRGLVVGGRDPRRGRARAWCVARVVARLADDAAPVDTTVASVRPSTGRVAPTSQTVPDGCLSDGRSPTWRTPVRRRPRLRAAPRRQDGDRLDGAARRPRRPLAGVHARGRAGLRGDRRGPVAGARLHVGVQHRRRRHRRHRRARARRHRPARRDAGDGGQGGAVQAVRRRRRRADLPRHHATSTRSSRPSRGSRRASAASTSRTSPRPLLRDRASGSRSVLDIPVFHDDQHGTAVVVLGRPENALRLTGRTPASTRVVDLRRRRRRRRGHQDPARCRHRDIAVTDRHGRR